MTYFAPPNKNEISAIPSPTNASANAGFGKLHDSHVGLLGTTGKPAEAFAAMKLLDSKALLNLKPTFSVAVNALTITVKDKDAVDLGVNNPGFVAQRHATIGDGGFNLRKLEANLSLVISAGSTLGHVANVLLPIYIYLIDNGGVQELAVSRTFQGEVGIFSTTAEGGAGGADSATVMYSTTARANLPGRLIAVAWFKQTVAGNWVNLPSKVQVPPLPENIPEMINGVKGVILSGLETSNNAVDPDHDIDTAPGVAVDDLGVDFIEPLSTLTKRIDGSWVVGSGQGGLDGTESVAGTPDANTWYYKWLIKRSDTDVTDAIWSESDTAPILPANYDRKVLIAAHRTDGVANIKPYDQDSGWFKWKTAVEVLSGGTASVSTAVVIAPAVPPIARAFGIHTTMTMSGNAGTISGSLTLRVAAGVDWLTPININQSLGGNGQGFNQQTGEYDVPGTGTFEYRRAIGGTALSGSANINVLGFKLAR